MGMISQIAEREDNIMVSDLRGTYTPLCPTRHTQTLLLLQEEEDTTSVSSPRRPFAPYCLTRLIFGEFPLRSRDCGLTLVSITKNEFSENEPCGVGV